MKNKRITEKLDELFSSIDANGEPDDTLIDLVSEFADRYGRYLEEYVRIQKGISAEMDNIVERMEKDLKEANDEIADLLDQVQVLENKNYDLEKELEQWKEDYYQLRERLG